MAEPASRFYSWRPWLRLGWYEVLFGLFLVLPIVLYVIGALLDGDLFARLVVLPSVVLLALTFRALLVGQGIRGYRLDDDGLTRVGRDGEAATVPWDQLKLTERADHTVVETPTAFWRLDDHVRGWRDLVRHLRQRLEPADAAERVEVPPEQAAAWLGMRPEETLVVRPRLPRAVLTAGALLTAAGVVMIRLGALDDAFGAMVATSVLLFGMALLGVGGSLLTEVARRRIRVGAWGIRYREGRADREVDWADVRDVWSAPRWNRSSLVYLSYQAASDDHEWVVNADGAAFRFHPADLNAGRLEHAVRQAIAAHEAGQVLPRMGDVPDTAISRVRPDATPERGLSLSEEG